MRTHAIHGDGVRLPRRHHTGRGALRATARRGTRRPARVAPRVRAPGATARARLPSGAGQLPGPAVDRRGPTGGRGPDELAVRAPGPVRLVPRRTGRRLPGLLG